MHFFFKNRQTEFNIPTVQLSLIYVVTVLRENNFRPDTDLTVVYYTLTENGQTHIYRKSQLEALH